MTSVHPDALLVVLAVAAAYLVVLRFIDLNEREPLWCVVLFLALGNGAAVSLRLLVDPATLELTRLPAAFCFELATLAAFLAGVAILGGAEHVRGWSEFTDSLDGIVYGAAAGLGVAVGNTLIHELAPHASIFQTNLLTLAWTSALAGLAYGLFGAIVGLGLGLTVDSQPSGRVLGVALSFVCAVAAHAFYLWLEFGNTLGGASSLARVWLALALPLVGVVGAAVHALRVERSTIEAELASEVSSGLVTAGDLDRVRRRGRRAADYSIALISGRIGRLARMMTRHNRQVQLALTKRRLAAARSARRRTALEREVEHLRAAVVALRQES
jgi:RsiW-degrading membrane proteinase PrsW (M82 family)